MTKTIETKCANGRREHRCGAVAARRAAVLIFTRSRAFADVTAIGTASRRRRANARARRTRGYAGQNAELELFRPNDDKDLENFFATIRLRKVAFLESRHYIALLARRTDLTRHASRL